jgi:hypothetical protein
MNKRHLISMLAVGAIASASPWLSAQTEVPSPTEEVTPAPVPAAEDAKTKAAADDALKNFKNPTPAVEPAPAETSAPAAAPEAPVAVTPESDPIIPAPPSPPQLDSAKEKAREMGVSDENIEKAEGALSKAAEKIKSADSNDVEDAMKALEALGAQAKKALEETEVTPDTPGAEGTARSVATEPGEDNSLMPDNLNLDSISPDAAARASQVVEELGADPDALAKIDAKRSEIVGRIMAESDKKKANLTFRKAFTAATNSPDAIALKASAEAAKTDPEKRDLLRQYYGVVFNDVRKRAPGIKKFADAREKEYLAQINGQVPPTEAVSLAPVDPAAAAPAEDEAAKPGTDT